jgi:nucleoside-diphosphate-sugar epimerase
LKLQEFLLIDLAQTFARHEILLTGGNGFLGKVLLALLLDRYPDFKHLHILIRPKGDLVPVERFQRDVLKSPPLRAITERLGERFLNEKITVWAGDASLPAATAVGFAMWLWAELTGHPPELTHREVGVFREHWAYSSEKARAELGYEPTPLREGLRQTLDWLREEGLA